MAPEMTKEKGIPRKLMYIAFGIVLWELSTALTPFDDMTRTSCICSSLKNARPPLPPDCPLAFRNLINRCWSSNPDKRPHFEEIVAILERYTESLEQDADFFSTYTSEESNIPVIDSEYHFLSQRRKFSTFHQRN
ncbi:hypothetical protein Leryth_021861 [Lithospermum erythrorhizon]|nr:hypothetical protein Leryth_021861 [Lithospermum erythrorhizon]